MSAWLSGWLRDIVLIILFATFIDLLIPNNSLQRYVKVVISLIVLLTILSPVIALFRADFIPKEASNQSAASAQSELPPLSTVLEAGGRLRLEAEDQSARLVETQMAGMIHERLIQAFNVHAAHIQVRIKPAKQDTGAVIAEIRISLPDLPAEQEGQAGNQPLTSDSAVKSESIPPVKKVEPVSVAVKSDHNHESSKKEWQQDEATDLPDRLLLAGRIKQHLREWWGVDERIISIEWSGAPKVNIAADKGEGQS